MASGPSGHVVFADSRRIDELRAEFVARGGRVYELATGPGADRKAFFDAVRRTLPLDPPLVSERSWDALADSLFEGLSTIDQVDILITWSGAFAFRISAPSEYATATDSLSDVAEQLADEKATNGEPKQLTVVIAT